MILGYSATLLLVVGFSREVYSQVVSVKDNNAIIEFYNNCTCVTEDKCDEHNQIFNYDPSLVMERRINLGTNRIQCQSDSSIKLYCCKQPRLEPSDRSPVNNNNVKCGKGFSPVTRRIGTQDNDEAPIDGEFPWMVAIFIKTSSGNYQYCCGGSLIHPKVVLTVNHRVYSKSASDFMVGANGQIQLPTKDEERRRVSEIVEHPRYAHRGRLYNDAALLILAEPFLIGRRINTLCLPPAGLDLRSTSCYVAGWGDDINGQRSQYMKKVQVPFVDRDRCETLLKNTKLGYKFSLHYSFMCAGGDEGKDACVGDGGSPLMCEMPSEEERYFQAGIVSWGIGCGKKDVPGVYTDVPRVTKWIKSTLKERNLEI